MRPHTSSDMPPPIVFSKKYAYGSRGHVFRAGKFEAALRILLRDGVVRRADIAEPVKPSRSDLLLAHAPAWVDKVLGGALTQADAERAELRLTARTLEAHLANVGGTILAARLALRTGLGVNCGGGAHHAFSDHGEGFCLLNDIAVAVNKMRAEKRVGGPGCQIERTWP